MSLTRHHDWEVRLHEFLQEREPEPFQWGRNDCALFACDAVLAMTGVDLAADFRNRYDNDLGAARVIISFTEGGSLGDLAAKIAGQHGIEEVGKLFARRGDIVLIPTENRRGALGVVSLDGWSVVGPGGPRRYELSYVERAWRI